ncbi:MAG TPA: hypothetical protein VKB50_31830 [Vicinamibacterales bacterium]|nr:hypothetical protein [Vicinamibacterales bacterium]
MIPSTPPSREHPTLPEEGGDVFNSQAIWLLIVLLALTAIVTVVSFGVIYYGDDVAVPSWSERSVPRPAR